MEHQWVSLWTKSPGPADRTPDWETAETLLILKTPGVALFHLTQVLHSKYGSQTFSQGWSFMWVFPVCYCYLTSANPEGSCLNVNNIDDKLAWIVLTCLWDINQFPFWNLKAKFTWETVHDLFSLCPPPSTMSFTSLLHISTILFFFFFFYLPGMNKAGFIKECENPAQKENMQWRFLIDSLPLWSGRAPLQGQWRCGRAQW